MMAIPTNKYLNEMVSYCTLAYAFLMVKYMSPGNFRLVPLISVLILKSWYRFIGP